MNERKKYNQLIFQKYNTDSLALIRPDLLAVTYIAYASLRLFSKTVLEKPKVAK